MISDNRQFDAVAVNKVVTALAPRFSGTLRHDRLYRAIYATDASIYQMTPDAVALPASVEDVAAAVRLCAEHGVAVTARGAGTGLTGGAVNRGIILDCSRHLRRIIHIDAVNRTATVEPGVVLDELNAAARPHGLQFAPDVAPSNRATLGGMIANNSCGAHSVIYGRTCDHVLSLRMVLSDGSIAEWGDGAIPTDNPLSVRAMRTLREVTSEYADEIRAKYPNILRKNGGYALDRLLTDDGRFKAETILCGSEGTLAVVVGATLRLVPLPRCKGLVIAHFQDLLDALAATPAALEHGPAAVELLDRLILNAAEEALSASRRLNVLQGRPDALLVIELYDEDEARLMQRLRDMVADLQSRRMGYAWPIITDPLRQDEVWSVRKSGLGLLMSRPGERQPYDFVGDTAVDPRRLRDYIARFQQVLAEEGVEDASYYAHASVGCLHVKPVLNLRRLDDVRRMVRVADRISSLALEFGGVMTGEHGDGLARSCWLEKMYGPRLIEAFRRIKTAFDPHGILNPGKIVDPLPMDENLRWRPVDSPRPLPGNSHASLTVLDFSRHGGMAGLAEMCSGVGQCRQRQVGVMCPSFMATGDELHTTRARANALRMALHDRSLLNGLDDPALDEVMDLCLSCKACKSECPTGVDMAKLKAEWLHHRNSRRGAPLRSRLVAAIPRLAAIGAMTPRWTNAVLQSRWTRQFAERLAGFSAHIAPPLLAPTTFHRSLTRHREEFARARANRSVSKGRVALFMDTWTNYFTPSVGLAAVRVLEAIGYEVIVPAVACCGRPAISKGLLKAARRLAEKNLAVLLPFAEQGIPIVGLEPSCILTFTDEFPQLLRTDAAKQIADHAVMIESFLARRENLHAVTLHIRDRNREVRDPVLYHGHCHQKAMVGTRDAMSVLDAVAEVTQIDSGCCGMAGSFGHEAEHYDIARRIGEERLFPAIRARGAAKIVVSGFSCACQIRHHTGIRARHVTEHLQDAMGL